MTDNDDMGIPSEFDVVVIGTGLSESILAGALCRIGQRVLHIDDRDYYGGSQATFNLKDFHNIDVKKPADGADSGTTARPFDESKLVLPDTDVFVPAAYRTDELQNIDKTIFVPEVDEPEPKKQEPQVAVDNDNNDNDWVQKLGQLYDDNEPVAISTPAPVDDKPKVESWSTMMQKSRKYCIDLTPKVCLSRGKLVKLLISANIGRYLEFKVVGDTFIHTKTSIREVPCSKQTLLLNRSVTPREKRQLMKFLQFCSTSVTPTTTDAAATPEEAPAPSVHEPETGATFGDYLNQKWKFSDDTAAFITFAIAGVTPAALAAEGIAAVQRYFMSIGGYGKTPFIYPLYGTGEIPQAFCRLAAVFGGIYVLRQKVDGFTLAKGSAKGSEKESANKCTGIVMNGKHISAKWVVTNSRCTPSTCSEPSRTHVSRAVLITDGHIVNNNVEPSVLLAVPPKTVTNPSNVNVLCLAAEAVACPAGKFLVQLTSPGNEGSPARADLEGVVGLLTRSPTDPTDAAKPTLLYAAYFTSTAPDHESLTLKDDTSVELSNVLLMRSRGSADLHFEDIVTEAEEKFRQMCPEEEFLPAAPNPEDVVWGNEDSVDEESEEMQLAHVEMHTAALKADVAELQETMDRIKSRLDKFTSK